MEKIIILDFGSQTTQLIARRLRDKGYYTEILPGDNRFTQEDLHSVKGIILSGSPESVYDDSAPVPDKTVYSLSIPLLGICYGFQRLVQDFGGSVKPLPEKEYGRSRITLLKESLLLDGIPDKFSSWMSHGDSIDRLPDGFLLIAKSENHPAVFEHSEKAIYGMQFHPEVTHCEYGVEILSNFAEKICQCQKDWNMEIFLENTRKDLQTKLKEKKVLLLISGGVDSTVVGALLLSTLNSAQVYLLYIDTGLMRSAETEEVTATLKGLNAVNLKIVDASERFLEALKGVTDPEEKRRIIGDLFIIIQEEEVAALNIEEAYLAQGTLYTDMIESGKGVGKKAKLIKSHHNVRSPMVEAKRDSGLLIEPLSKLYKDEVRILGRNLGLSPEVVGRHPFPGPGLAVRILGEVTKEKCDILREADALFIRELRKRGLYNRIWQAFCVLLPVRSVGVAGDLREYGYVLALRAIISEDGMTSDVYPFEMKDLLEISSLITNKIKKIGRVVYDISSKPPATIEWE